MEKLGDGTTGYKLHIQSYHPVEVGSDGCKIMVDDEEGFSFISQLSQDLYHRDSGGDIDTGKELVEEIDIGVLHEGSGEESTLLLTS